MASRGSHVQRGAANGAYRQRGLKHMFTRYLAWVLFSVSGAVMWIDLLFSVREDALTALLCAVLASVHAAVACLFLFPARAGPLTN